MLEKLFFRIKRVLCVCAEVGAALLQLIKLVGRLEQQFGGICRRHILSRRRASNLMILIIRGVFEDFNHSHPIHLYGLLFVS